MAKGNRGGKRAGSSGGKTSKAKIISRGDAMAQYLQSKGYTIISVDGGDVTAERETRVRYYDYKNDPDVAQFNTVKNSYDAKTKTIVIKESFTIYAGDKATVNNDDKSIKDFCEKRINSFINNANRREFALALR